METTRNTQRTYELQGSYTFTGTCTCGKCRIALRDSYGNIDYGCEWSDERSNYIPRDCEIAEMRREDRR